MKASPPEPSQERGIGVVPISLTVLACILLVAPHLVVAATSFDPSPAALFPPTGFSFEWYLNAFQRPAFREGLLLSVVIASASALVAVVVGTMASYVLVRYRFRGRDFAITALQLPMMMPEVVLGLGFLILFTYLKLHFSSINVLFAHAIITLPYAARVISANLYTVSATLEEAAHVLGAGPVLTFFRVVLPIIKPGIIAAAVFSFVVSFDNFTVTAFLITDRGTLPIEIYSYIRTESDPTIAAISTILIVVSIIGVLTLERLTGLDRIARSGSMH